MSKSRAGGGFMCAFASVMVLVLVLLIHKSSFQFAPENRLDQPSCTVSPSLSGT